MKRFLGLVGIILWAAAARGADVGDLVKQLENGDNDARRAAAKALGEGGAESKAAVPALIKALKDHDTFVRRFSAQALGEIGLDAKSAVPALATMLDDPKKVVQSAAANALGKLGPSGVETLVSVLRDDNKDAMTRRQAIHSLSDLGPAGHSAVPVLTELLKEKTGKEKTGKKKVVPNDLRTDAATALGSLAKADDTDAIETLSALMDKKSKAPRELKQAANQALRKIRRNK
jgi:HEAT repeat protein